jgi:hypothetical protein
MSKLGGIIPLPKEKEIDVLVVNPVVNPVGRPRATPEMKQAAKQKQKLRMKLTAQHNKAIKDRNWSKYIEIVEKMKEEGLIGQKAYDNRVKTFTEEKTEVEIDETAEDIAYDAMQEALLELEEEDIKLPVAEEVKTPPIPITDYTDEDIKKATQKLVKMERQASLERQAEKKKRSQVSEHFTSYEKPKTTTLKSKIPYDTMPKELKNNLRDYLRDNFDLVPDYEQTVLVMDNFVDDDTKERLLEGDLTAAKDIANIIKTADLTAKFVPEYLEGNEDMTKEERQILFHRNLIKGSIKNVKAQRERPKTNFDKTNEMSGGVSAGLTTSKLQSENYKTPEIFNDNEFILDSKITENAMSREMFKGINPNSLNGDGEFTEEEMAKFFSNLNEINNRQDDAEIGNALNNIEILSGGTNDSLFGTQDLTTTQGANQPSQRGAFQEDMPDHEEFNPAPISRGRNAQALREVDPDAISRQDRIENATTIGLGVGILGNSFRGIFGKNDIPATRQTDILSDFNQNMRLVGKRGMYGNNEVGFKDNDLYEGFSFDNRVKGLSGYDYARDYNSVNGIRDPYMLQKEPQKLDASALTEALAFNRGTVQGASLPQLRQEEFDYKQANRYTKHDGRAFIRGGKRTGILLDNEFEV